MIQSTSRSDNPVTEQSKVRAATSGFRLESVGSRLDSRGGLYGVGEARCSVGGRQRAVEKRYAAWALGTVDSGAFRYTAEAGQVLAVPGAILFGNAGEAFTCQHLGPRGNRRSVIAIGDTLMLEVAEALGLDELAFKASAAPPGPQTAALCDTIRYVARSECILEDVLIELIAAALATGRRQTVWKRQRGDSSRILKVVSHLADSFAEPHTLDELADRARLSRFHFIRVFRQVTGVSPHQYLIGQRLRAAALSLRTTSWPITRVAVGTGFDDISHFNRTFRRAFGMSPRQWR